MFWWSRSALLRVLHNSRQAPHLSGRPIHNTRRNLKAFREETYTRYIRGRFQQVLEALKTIKSLGIWLEVTTPVIPGINDMTLLNLQSIGSALSNSPSQSHRLPRHAACHIRAQKQGGS